MNLRGAKELSVATVNLQYTVQVASSKTNTYDLLSTQLTHSVESGVFTTFLHYYSLNLDVFALFAASSSSVTTKDTTTYEPTESTSSDTSSCSVLPVAAIVGIVLGVMAGVVIGVRVFMLWCKWRQSQMDEILHEDTLQRRGNVICGPYRLSTSSMHLTGCPFTSIQALYEAPCGSGCK